MTHRTALALIPALLVALAFAGASRAQPIQKEQPGIAFTGKVTAVDAKTKTLRVIGANSEEGVFQVDEKDTTIMSGSQEIALSALHEGEWVSIDADMRGGQKVATYIEVVEDPHGGGGASSSQPTPVTARIEVRHNNLSPALVQLHAGETVTFHNVDKMPGGHTVMAVDGSFSSPPLDKGQDWSHSFDVPGVYQVRIKEHPDAVAKIVVE
jgi:plastocyanin